jgi:predicted metal-dependent peptidase
MSADLKSKLMKAKIELMTRSAFISTISLSARHIITDTVPTAEVSGTTIKYNPTFIEKLSVGQFAGLMAHECWHLAFQHASRRGNRCPDVWNVAGDYIINWMLNKNGFELPPNGCLDAKYGDGWSTDTVYDDLMKNNPNCGNQLTMKDLPPNAPGEEAPGANSDVVNAIVRAKTQAQISGGQHAGDIPGEILRTIDKLLNPVLPWPVILNRFLDQRVREEYSWARRNRRYRAAYLPSLHSYGLGHLTFAIDTSGSVSDDELTAMLSEIKGIRDVFNPERMTIIDCDSEIHAVHDVNQNTNIMDLAFTGGGGTSFQPVLDYVDKHPTQALIYFTDLYGEKELKEVDYPILWICNSEHSPMNIGETIYVNP